jgi:hypothetical protein
MVKKIEHGTKHEHDMVHEGHDRTHKERKDGGHVEPHDLGPDGRKHGGAMHKKRARGGHVEEHKKEHEKEHHAKRKHGGAVKGKAAAHRPDKRARGGGNDGGTADLSPETAAGKMSSLPFERKQIPMEGGKGTAMEKRAD